MITQTFSKCYQVAGRERKTVTYIGRSGEGGIITQKGSRAYGTVDLLDSSYRLQCREDGRVFWAKLDSFDANHHTVLQNQDAEVEEGLKM